jgi:two-component system copper resistance phosphate regulon response regulator CusR
MKILLIEDDQKTVNYLTKGLTELGYSIDNATDGREGLFLAKEYQYDLIILDVMLPLLDGWTVIQRIREQNKITPILFLSARDSIEERVKGFELGADDYLIKPFAFSELAARIKSIVRRGQQQQVVSMQIDDLNIDLVSHKVSRAGKNIELTPKEFSLLTLLARRQGSMVSRTIIAEQVWGIHFETDTNTIDVAIKRLRQKIDLPFNRKLIHTVRGIGYVLEVRE